MKKITQKDIDELDKIYQAAEDKYQKALLVKDEADNHRDIAYQVLKTATDFCKSQQQYEKFTEDQS